MVAEGELVSSENCLDSNFLQLEKEKAIIMRQFSLCQNWLFFKNCPCSGKCVFYQFFLIRVL